MGGLLTFATKFSKLRSRMAASPESRRWRKFGLRPRCGLFCLLPVQRKSPLLLDRVTDFPAAAQHDFPKPDIQIVQLGRNPIRPFAALPFYVSQADKAVVCRRAFRAIDYLVHSSLLAPFTKQSFASDRLSQNKCRLAEGTRLVDCGALGMLFNSVCKCECMFRRHLAIGAHLGV